jgi:preprotein translocase subunit SecD
MKVCARRFNVYFALAAVLVLLCGCKTDQQRERDQAAKVVGALRVHLEASPNDAGTTQTISVPRSDPVLVTIADEPILTEANLIAARVIDTPGAPGIEVRFDEISASLLEQYSAANPGRHFAIFGQWGEKLSDGRWLAAPLITHRISDGTLAFTPDCSREEANQLVLGLNNVAAKINKSSLK